MRLTLDIDSKKELRECFRRIDECFSLDIIDEVWESSSKRGYHVVIYGLNFSFEEVTAWRYMLGDDRKRIYIDTIRQKRGHATQVLFTSKDGKRAKKVYDSSKDKISKLHTILHKSL